MNKIKKNMNSKKKLKIIKIIIPAFKNAYFFYRTYYSK